MNQRGVTLIEMLVAVAILGVVILGAATFLGNQSSMGARTQGRTSNVFFQQSANVVLANVKRCKTAVRMTDVIPAVIPADAAYGLSIDTDNTGTFWKAGDKPTGYPNFQIKSLKLKNIIDLGVDVAGYHGLSGVVVMEGQSFFGSSEQVSPPVTLAPFNVWVDGTNAIVGCGPKPPTTIIYRDITANTYNYNLFVDAGSPAIPVEVVLTVYPGVLVCSHNVTDPSLETGIFVSGSRVTIINKGTIEGHGGDGGGSSAAGTMGGPALSLSYPVILDNLGSILGGGGGGGGGGPNWVFWGIPGGGGGGGQGCDPGNGGAGGGGGGGAGSYAGPGPGGGIFGITFYGGGGGAAGMPGQSGTGWWPPLGPGGPAGASIIAHGNAIVWKAHGTVMP